MSSEIPAIFIMGPTACGKTDVAVRLSQQLPCDIISVDSAMVYCGMNIGTAKPDADVLKIAPHRLIDIRDPNQPYSAAEFVSDANAQINSIRKNGRIPLLVGGTGLYFKALQFGLSPLPTGDKSVREGIDQEANQIGWTAMHARLSIIDPVAAKRIHPNDPQRIQRALEVYQLSGTPISTLQQQAELPDQTQNKCIKIILAASDREALRQRIATRFHQMLEQGFVAEVQSLYNRKDLHQNLPSIRAVGYRQMWLHLQGELSYEQMIQNAIVATRQFAKRQYTWLRSEANTQWIDSMDSNHFDKILKTIAKTQLPRLG